MCGGKPCFTSVCGLSLQKSVMIIGFVQLGITLIATILNVVKMSRGYDDEECEGKDVCIGAIIKYAVFDALFGVACSLMLIFGAKLRNHCLLVFWMLVTVVTSAKYLWIVATRDWTDLEVNINCLNNADGDMLRSRIGSLSPTSSSTLPCSS